MTKASAKITIKKICAIFFLASFFLINFIAPSIAAEGNEGIIAEQNRVIQNQQQFEQDKQRKTELQIMENEKKSDEIETELEDEESAQAKIKRCFDVKKISFAQNRLLTLVEENNLAEKYLDRCLLQKDIEEMLQKIADYLSSKEYPTSRAEVLFKDKTNGEIAIKIIEGKLHAIKLNDDNNFDKRQKFFAFGNMPSGDLLSLHDVVIGVDQINRLASNSASVKIVPSGQENSSIVEILNKPKNTFRTSFAVDDLGTRSTGKRRDTITLAYDNLFHANDNLTISRTANDFSQKKNLGKNEAVNIAFSVPFKGNLLSVSHNHYEYSLVRASSNNIDQNIKASGRLLTTSATLESILFKVKKYRLKSQITFANKDIGNYVDGLRVDSTSRRANILTFAFPNKFFLDKTTILLKPSYIKGLDAFGAKKDGDNISNQSPHSQFDVFKFYANYAKELEIAGFKAPINYNLIFDSQLSKQRLYSNDQFFVGGPYTVRGFENGLIGGDSGYVIKNEFKFNLGKTILPFLPEKYSQKFIHLNKFSITPFYDYGHVKLYGINSSGRLSGTGFKTSFAGKNLTANLTMAWVIDRSSLLQNNYSQNQAIYFDVTANFGFF